MDEIREIRASEIRFYKKITDIYVTAMDYSVAASITQTFFKTVQNKLHFAIHGKATKRQLKNIPIVFNVDFGYVLPFATFPVGGVAKIKAIDTSVSLEILKH